MKLRTLGVSLALVAGLSVAFAAPAAATATKCTGSFCATVVGTGLHVDYVYFSEKVPARETWTPAFWLEGELKGSGTYGYHFDTGNYRWVNDTSKAKTFTTGHWTINKNFENHTPLDIGDSYLNDLLGDIEIHS